MMLLVSSVLAKPALARSCVNCSATPGKPNRLKPERTEVSPQHGEGGLDLTHVPSLQVGGWVASVLRSAKLGGAEFRSSTGPLQDR